MNFLHFYSIECEVTLNNTSKEPVEQVEMSLDSKLHPDLLHKVFVWNKENLESQLPLAPGCQACFTLYIHGASDFLPLSQSGESLGICMGCHP